jgi:Protein of unknown function (DUF3179)
MTPRIDDETHWFAEHGLYDGLFLMMDEESGTYWDHLTGRAVYGPLVGETLPTSAGLMQTTVAQVLRADPDALITLSDQAIRTNDQVKVDGLLAGIGRRLGGMFQSTVEKEDDRRPTMDLGIGLWTSEDARYYPLDVVRAADRALVDAFGDERVVVLIDPESFVLTAFRTEAESAQWDDDVLRLSDGSYIEGGIMHDASGERVADARPFQVFTRWYGFSLTFPHTDIYGEG